MKFLPALLLFAFTPLLPAQELKTGEPLTASDLAKQLNVQNWTLVYKPGKEFSNVRFALIYRFRETKDAEFTEQSLIVDTRQIQPPTKELPITICFDSNQSTLIFSGGSSAGKGIDIPGSYSISTPPTKEANGRYKLLSTILPPESTPNVETTQGILELEISAE